MNIETEKLKRNIIQSDISVKTIIQEIKKCDSSNLLNELNAEGRFILNNMKQYIDQLENTGKELRDTEILIEAEHLINLYRNTFRLFRQANVDSMLIIEKDQKNKLFHLNDEEAVRRRQKSEKSNLVKMSSNITQQLLSISRHLAETTEKSAETLNTLVGSSQTVTGTQQELHSTQGVIAQSSKLLNKYGRRQFTDKILIFLAFGFFLGCCLYIFQKRLL